VFTDQPYIPTKTDHQVTQHKRQDKLPGFILGTYRKLAGVGIGAEYCTLKHQTHTVAFWEEIQIISQNIHIFLNKSHDVYSTEENILQPYYNWFRLFPLSATKVVLNKINIVSRAQNNQTHKYVYTEVHRSILSIFKSV